MSSKYTRICGRDGECNVIAIAIQHMGCWKVIDQRDRKQYGSFNTRKRAESCLTERLGCTSLEHGF